MIDIKKIFHNNVCRKLFNDSVESIGSPYSWILKKDNKYAILYRCKKCGIEIINIIFNDVKNNKMKNIKVQYIEWLNKPDFDYWYNKKNSEAGSRAQ
jgi:hypothetical protein